MDETLENEHRLLLRVLDDNAVSLEKNMWQIAFHWWRYYYHFNKQLDAAKELAEKVAIIEQYMAQSRSLVEVKAKIIKDLETEVMRRGDLEAKEVPLNTPTEDMIRMMQQESLQFTKRLKAVKRQKEGKAPTSSKRARKPRIAG
jgi:hypothetical protein